MTNQEIQNVQSIEQVSALACFNSNPTKKYAERKELDHYPTESDLCRAALSVVPLGKRILDPGAGLGRWGAVAAGLCNAHITGIEIRETERAYGYSKWLQGSYIHVPTPTLPVRGKKQTDEQFARVMRKYEEVLWASQQPIVPERPDFYDLVIGNPPYSDAEEFVRRALREVREGGRVLFLLRAAFTHGQDRNCGLFIEHPIQRIYTLPERPSFTGDGKTDSTEYSLFLWRKGWRGETTIKPLWWKQRSAGTLFPEAA